MTTSESPAGGQDGIFNTDTRYLSRLELLLNGMQPLLLGSNLRGVRRRRSGSAEKLQAERLILRSTAILFRV
jgi:N-terminal domain of (some) glycogen debranching enzymes